jgi:hypothetical protein
MVYVIVGGVNRAYDTVWPDAPLGAPIPNPHEPVAHTPPVQLGGEAVKFMSPPLVSPDLNANTDDNAPRQFMMLANVLGPATPSGLANKQVNEEVLAAINNEPSSGEEALKDEVWHKAMQEEIDSIEENKT